MKVKYVRAVLDASLQPRLTELLPLIYASDSNRAQDVPPHVRAASAIRRSRARLVIIQDDVNVLAFHHEQSGVQPLLLPAGTGGRRTFDDRLGNKHLKMDLEACAILPDQRIVAFGSGSTPRRQMLVVLAEDAALHRIDASDLYDALRAESAFAGSELNIEGALVVQQVVRLFQRGNGSTKAGVTAVNATVDLPLAEFCAWLDRQAALPRLENIVQYDLGTIDGVAYGFTDAALMPDGRVAAIACAEASPDVTRDGAVLGCRFGIIEAGEMRLSDVCDADGRAITLKIEGLELRVAQTRVFDVVVDVDHPDHPACIGRLEITD